MTIQERTTPSRHIIPFLGCLLFFSVMNVTVFNIAIPDISHDLALAPSLAGWVITGYSMVYAVGSLMYGKLADLFPLKSLMTVGIIVFSVGSLIGFFSEGYAWLLVGRLVQSVGASSVPALAMIIPARYFPPERRGAVMGVVASFIAFSSGIGPVVGGFVAGSLGWKYLFLLSLGTLVILPFLRRALPSEQRNEGHIDMVGAATLAVSVAMLMLTITTSQWAYGAVSAAMLAIFIVRSRKAREPFVSLSLFTAGPFRYAVLAAFLSSAAGFSMMLIIPLLLQSAFGMTANRIGFILFPAAMAAALLGRSGGRWTDRFGSIRMMLTAGSLMMAGFVLMAGFAQISSWIIAACLILPNIGFVFMQSALSKLVSLMLPKEQIGAGMGVFSLCNFLSGAIGGSITTRLVDVQLPYSTIFICFACAIVLQLVIVYVVLRKKVNASGISTLAQAKPSPGSVSS